MSTSESTLPWTNWAWPAANWSRPVMASLPPSRTSVGVRPSCARAAEADPRVKTSAKMGCFIPYSSQSGSKHTVRFGRAVVLAKIWEGGIMAPVDSVGPPEILRILAVTDALGLHREAVSVPLWTEGDGRLRV